MLKLEIVTPEKLVFSQDVGMAVLPASEGEIGILANHQPTITELKEGEITIYDNDNNVTQQFSITNGFAEIRGGKCTVLSDCVTVVDENNPAPAHGSSNRSKAEKEFLKH